MNARLDRITRSVVLVATLLSCTRLAADDTLLRDGPYVFWHGRSTVEVLSVCDGGSHGEVHDLEQAAALPDPCMPGTAIWVEPLPPTPPAAMWPMPEQLLAVSDIEGNHDALMGFLKGNKVLDEAGAWTFGKGHLVFVGDIVDRGDKVTEVLNAIMRLEREAAAGGGRVHFVLGNHEAMVLSGDVRYIHPKYETVCEITGMPYETLLGANTLLGRWLRTRNAVVCIGDWMFVHAGYSPELDALAISPDALNAKVRAGLGGEPWPKPRTLKDHPVWHKHGPLWYRGYHQRHQDDFGSTTSTQAAAITTRHGVKHIAVGHTVVDDVSWLDTDRRLLGIDVQWADPDEAEGLLVDAAGTWAVDANGTKRPLLPTTQP